MDKSLSLVFLKWPCLFKAHRAGTTWVERRCLGAWAVLAPVSKVSTGVSLGPCDGDSEGIILTTHTHMERVFSEFLAEDMFSNRAVKHSKTYSSNHTTPDSVWSSCCTNKSCGPQRIAIGAGLLRSWINSGGRQSPRPSKTAQTSCSLNISS